jgi:signal transduction histidine kinase
LPILVAGEIQGLVLALFDGVDGTLDPEGMEMAGAISGALTPVVELELLREESKRNLAEREDFWHMTSSVLEETELQRALELVCREARHITRAGGSAILLLEETGELGVAFSVGDGADWSDELLFQTMAPEPCTVPAEPVILHDLSRRLDIPEAEIIRDVIVVPLCVHGKSIGALQIVNPREKLPRDQLKAVTQLADRVAVVIEHFQLHDKRERMVILEERSRMARELHDSVTQSVYAVTVFAEAAARLLDRNQVADASRTLREVRDAALRALREMRGLIFELHPPEIDKIDLIEALQARLAAVEGRAGLKTEFLCPGVRSLPQDIKEGLYRIAQEALNNTMKHAHASKITLRLAESSTGVSLELEDDGVGFELDEGTSEGGLGLPGMRERAEAMNGTISIKTSPGGGTSITIDVPFDQTKATSAGC